MKLHILSDLHLSVSTFDPPETDADVIILAGDIARPKEAITWAKQFLKPVIYVPGNHEFYGNSIVATVHELKRLCATDNIYVLHNDAVVIEGVRFLGATLWTDFKLFGEVGEQRDFAINMASATLRDFSRIYLDDSLDTLFTPEDAMSQFQRHASWLNAQLDEPFAGQTVVITHHSPSINSIHPRFASSPLNPCFVSDAEWLVDGQRSDLWIHGHTHDSFDYYVNGTRVVCNPRGYSTADIIENPYFDPALVIEVGK
ncbi:metallophosphoesterase [Neptunomonas antarctica]|uniref:Calcineurin-like phosphoesterase n=1 Tax=Neptunomonas antarctica TaxID=619304 RepID=A0A1N7MVE0_9GAMM|nr:metallophosphoesterase [Neptunomonas antarctica]SIS90093.1 Calcineurin-like phosphoesterase [Neptunomonas antarctica]